MRRAIVVISIYSLKLILIVWRATRCLIPSDRLSSPLSVMLRHLMIRTNEMINSCHYNLPSEVDINSLESCKMPEAL